MPTQIQQPKTISLHNYKNSGEIRRLSEKELQQKRELGLCFRCDEKWSINHRCQGRGLSVLLTEEEEEVTKVGEFSVAEISPGETNTTYPNLNLTPEVSLSSVMGLTSPKTMRLAEIMNERTVVVMVDPGATHNFVSEVTIEKLGLHPIESRSFGVTLGTGETVQGEGVCTGVVLELQGIKIVEDFLILPLGSSDVILGIQWLEKLGTITTNWKTQTLKFQLDGTTVTLKGDRHLG